METNEVKKLEELGISPAPWKVGGSAFDVVNATDEIITDDYDYFSRADAHLIAAAPELYDALYGLMEIVCDDCKSPYKVDGKCVKCPRVKAAEAALAKASGESEVRHD